MKTLPIIVLTFVALGFVQGVSHAQTTAGKENPQTNKIEIKLPAPPQNPVTDKIVMPVTVPSAPDVLPARVRAPKVPLNKAAVKPKEVPAPMLPPANPEGPQK